MISNIQPDNNIMENYNVSPVYIIRNITQIPVFWFFDSENYDFDFRIRL